MIKKTRSADGEWAGIEKEAPSLDLSAGSDNALVRLLSAIGLKTNPGRSTDNPEIKLKFLRAGLQGRNVPTVFWGTKFLLAVLLPMGFLIATMIYFPAMTFFQTLYGVSFFAILGLFLPDIWLSVRTSGRKERLFKGVPDALDLLVVCVEAGMGLDAAFNRVGAELGLSHPELSQELNLLNLELRAGKPRQAALRNLADRTNIDDVNSLVTLLIQTDRFGTSAAQALRVFSDTFRTTRYQRAEEIAAKIATKLIFPLVLCIFPSMFVVVLAPAVIRIYRVMFVQ
jgi:tight adherence protein C